MDVIPQPIGRLYRVGYNGGVWGAWVATEFGKPQRHFPCVNEPMKNGQLVYVLPNGRVTTTRPEFEIDYIDLPGARPGRFIVAEWRDGSGYDTPHWYIFSETSSKERLADTVSRMQRHKTEYLVFEARNRTQVKDWLLANQERVVQFGMDYHKPHPQEGTTMVQHRLDALLTQRERLDAEITRLSLLPDEPEGLVDDSEYNIIAWNARFDGGSTTYYYAARKAGDGLWYTTGPRSEQGYTWTALIDWIATRAKPVDGMIWPVTEVEGVQVG